MKQIKIVGAFSIAIIVVVSVIVLVLASEATGVPAQLTAEQDACRVGLVRHQRAGASAEHVVTSAVHEEDGAEAILT